MKSIPKDAAEYAAKFGVYLTMERYGIYGDEWDYVAKPAKPSWYPTAGEFRTPVGTDPKGAIRTMAERMGTGRWSSSRLNYFEATPRSVLVADYCGADCAGSHVEEID